MECLDALDDGNIPSCLSRHSPRPLWNLSIESNCDTQIEVSVGIRPDLYGIKLGQLESHQQNVSVGIRPDLYGIPEFYKHNFLKMCLSRHSPRPLWNLMMMATN